MNYAIVEASGTQVLMEVGKFYDLNYISGNPGDTVNINRVLLSCKNNKIQIGTPCLSASFVKTKILKHFKGRKVTVFKIKPKKNYRSKNGHRQKFTRILVEDIIE